MTYEEIEDYVKNNLKYSRYKHTLGVIEMAEKLSSKYNVNIEKARVAALIHDCAKYKSDEEIINIVKSHGYKMDDIEEKNPQILHGLVAAIIGKEVMGIKDEEIFNAVAYHTTAKEDMSCLEKIIYIADYIEPYRNFPGVEDLRRETFNDLNKGVLKALDNTIKFVISEGNYLHLNTIKARNYLLYCMGNKER